MLFLATSGGVWPRMAKSALLVLNIANFGPDLAQMSLLGCFGGGVKMVILALLGQIWSFLSGPGLGVWTDLRVGTRMGRGNHQIAPPSL